MGTLTAIFYATEVGNDRHLARLKTKNRKLVKMDDLVNLYAVLEEIAGYRVAFLLVKGLAEDDNLLEEENTPLPHARQDAGVLVTHHEGVLEQKPALGHDFTLGKVHRELLINGYGVQILKKKNTAFAYLYISPGKDFRVTMAIIV